VEYIRNIKSQHYSNSDSKGTTATVENLCVVKTIIYQLVQVANFYTLPFNTFFIMASPIEKPTVLITGCTKGSIGYSLAKEFAARNYHVYATSRRIQSMGDLSTIQNITLLPLDVTSLESIREAHAKITKETDGKLDILYHNAGYRSLAMAIETSFEEAFKMFNANLFGILEMNKIFAPMVVAAKGKIVFTGSVSGYTPHPSQAVYNSSKAAVELYARTLRIEMRPLGVRVVFVNTAGVNTGMSSDRLVLSAGMY
jgi:1-acylglycerone phosphate reductase